MKFIPQDDNDKDMSFLFADQKTELTEEEVKEIEKEVFLDWLMLDNRDEELEEAAADAEKHSQQIDEFVDYICKERQFEEWLKQRDNNDNDFTGYY